MRMIDADALHEAFDEEGADICADYGGISEWGFGYRLVHDLIANTPTIEAVEVVRCKDCKYAAKAQWNKKGYWICPASHMEITDDDFCSYGERREEK